MASVMFHQPTSQTEALTSSFHELYFPKWQIIFVSVKSVSGKKKGWVSDRKLQRSARHNFCFLNVFDLRSWKGLSWLSCSRNVYIGLTQLLYFLILPITFFNAFLFDFWSVCDCSYWASELFTSDWHIPYCTWYFFTEIGMWFFPLNYNDNAAFLVVPDICILAFSFHWNWYCGSLYCYW